jgi:hypothetical protein
VIHRRQRDRHSVPVSDQNKEAGVSVLIQSEPIMRQSGMILGSATSPRHCERSEAIQEPRSKNWIASSFALRASADAVVARAPRNDGVSYPIQLKAIMR